MFSGSKAKNIVAQILDSHIMNFYRLLLYPLHHIENIDPIVKLAVPFDLIPSYFVDFYNEFDEHVKVKYL